MRRALVGIFLAPLLLGCGAEGRNHERVPDGGLAGALPDASGRGGPDAEVGAAPPDPLWTPETTLRSDQRPRRGLLDLRGLIHQHSVHSHDACDGEPRLGDGGVNEPCDRDFRAGMCAAAHDFIMLTDHPALFAEVEYPEALLFRPQLGDTLVERGTPVANRAACPDGASTLIIAGAESRQVMPVGLERHVPLESRDAYARRDPESISLLHGENAVVLVSHTEDVAPEELIDNPVDGFEMYNLHANLERSMAAAVPLLAQLNQPERLMHPDLVVLPILSEDPVYLATWGTVLARGVRRVTTLGTDAHQNALPMLLPDGERVDSFRRMNRWFSNHLLVRPEDDGSWDDRHLKDALRAGRLYGVFEVMGYARGFDFHASVGGSILEMGESVEVSEGPELHVALPEVRGLDPDAEAPELVARLLRAVEGGWEVVAEAAGKGLDLRLEVAGAYRAEVRMRPRHLAPFLNDHQELAERELVWIYSNAIYVR